MASFKPTTIYDPLGALGHLTPDEKAIHTMGGLATMAFLTTVFQDGAMADFVIDNLDNINPEII